MFTGLYKSRQVFTDFLFTSPTKETEEVQRATAQSLCQAHQLWKLFDLQDELNKSYWVFLYYTFEKGIAA